MNKKDTAVAEVLICIEQLDKIIARRRSVRRPYSYEYKVLRCTRWSPYSISSTGLINHSSGIIPFDVALTSGLRKGSSSE